MRVRYFPGGLSLILLAIAAAADAQDTASPRAAGTRNAIVGKVIDQAGTPVPAVFVTIVERDTVHGLVRFHPSDVRLSALTDHRGEYRLDNLYPGEYFVVAIPQNPPTRDGRVTRTGLAIAYYPAARNAAEAMPVRVGVQQAQTADITVRSAALAVVSGRVFTSSGQPAAAGLMGLTHGDNLFGLDGKAVRLRPDGSFLLAGLAPGTYFLQYREGQWPPPRDATPLVSGAKVVVDGKDLAGVRVDPIRMVRATGRVMVAPAVRASLQPSAVTVSAFPKIIDGNPGPQRAGRVHDDLSFEFATWPGPGRVRVSFDTPGWKVKAVRYKGADVTETGIDFKEGQEISGIEIELARADGRGGPEP
jgi:Carboxypeptidase regulatory-like domain